MLLVSFVKLVSIVGISNKNHLETVSETVSFKLL